ncbi:AAA family ATPase [Anaerosoma tenue]|uniref:AAA family ATPase n=1 Tax=Anaerosoma tenue TaxID=2933588 RepID=UPI0022608A08|nr:AAA family ATPase [Anaerosoma tenue]MCK8113966.1 helicase RepA family protein [Anaerosoma tenue]
MSDDVLVDGLLKVGDVGVLAAPPKAGKTLALEDLAVALAGSHVGRQEWMGRRCEPWECEGPDDILERIVLYLNLEIPADERRARHRSALAARGLTEEDVKHSYFAMDLRDTEGAWDFDALWQQVKWHVNAVSDLEYVDLIVIDPIYMLVDGDENSNKAMAAFLSQEIAAFRDVYRCAVVFSHHFIKAWRSVKSHEDRIAGAGTLSRYPDSIMTLSPATAGRTEFNATTRSMDFHDIRGLMLIQDGPRFVECSDTAAEAIAGDPFETKLRAAFDELSTSGPVRVSELAKKLRKDRSSLYGRLPKYGFNITKGVVTPSVVGVEPDPTTDNNSGGV